MPSTESLALQLRVRSGLGRHCPDDLVQSFSDMPTRVVTPFLATPCRVRGFDIEPNERRTLRLVFNRIAPPARWCNTSRIGIYSAVGRCALLGILSVSFPASVNILLISRKNAAPADVRWTSTLRLSSGSGFRRTRSNSPRRSSARVIAGFDTLSSAASPRIVCASSFT